MNIAILTFEGFNELDSFIAFGILNRLKDQGWNVKITSPSKYVTSMNGVKIQAQEQLEFANTADVVLIGSGINTRDIAKDKEILNRLNLNTEKQLICAQCSGTLLLKELGVLGNISACTDLTSKPWVREAGIEVLDQAFYAKGNIATAGGCSASSYLATWIILKLASLDLAKAAIYYVAPVGEKDSTVEHHMKIVSAYV